VTQEWFGEHCPDFIDKDSWPPNSPDLNPLDYHVWGAMLEKFNELKPKPQNIAELTIWDDPPQWRSITLAAQGGGQICRPPLASAARCGPHPRRYATDPPNETVRKYVSCFRKRLVACIKAEGGHFKHSLN